MAFDTFAQTYVTKVENLAIFWSCLLFLRKALLRPWSRYRAGSKCGLS